MKITVTEDIERQVILIHRVAFVGSECAPSGVVKNQMRHGHVFVDGEPIHGYAIVEMREEPYLWEMAVSPMSRGRGIAARLLKDIERWASDYRTVSLTVRATNDVAIHVYEKAGYLVDRRLKRFYPNEDGLLMKKELRREV